jgi:hypothetical protein
MRLHNYAFLILAAVLALYVATVAITPEWSRKAKVTLQWVVPIAVFLLFGLVYAVTKKKPDDLVYEFLFCQFYQFPVCTNADPESQKGKEEGARRSADQNVREDEARRLAEQKEKDDEARQLAERKAREDEAQRQAEQRPGNSPRISAEKAQAPVATSVPKLPSVSNPKAAAEVAKLRGLVQVAERVPTYEAVFASCQNCVPFIFRCRQFVNSQSDLARLQVGFSAGGPSNLRDFLDRTSATGVSYRTLGAAVADLNQAAINCVAQGGQELR